MSFWKKYWIIPFFGVMFTIIATNALYIIDVSIIKYTSFSFLVLAIFLPFISNNNEFQR